MSSINGRSLIIPRADVERAADQTGHKPSRPAYAME
jgi:hypothetical protein